MREHERELLGGLSRKVPELGAPQRDELPALPPS